MLTVYRKNRKTDREWDMAHAWQTARLMKLKKVPSLKELLHGRSGGVRKLEGAELERFQADHAKIVAAAERARRRGRRSPRTD